MKDDMRREIEASLADHGFRGVFVVNRSGIVTLDAGLPATDEALQALEAAFEERIESTEVSMPEEALAS
jgi:hypothetical protein